MTDYEDMCPNCVTPWKCNEPHIPYGSVWRRFPRVYNFLYNRFGFDNKVIITSDGASEVKNDVRYLMHPHVRNFLKRSTNDQ